MKFKHADFPGMTLDFLEWKEHYETGLLGYDAQHKTLFRLANRIHECLVRKTPGSDLEIGSVFGAFLEMTRTHVRTEDELMAWYQHEPARGHETAHLSFIKGLEAIANQPLDALNHRERLGEMLLMFKAHFEAEDEQAFLAVLRRRNLPSAG